MLFAIFTSIHFMFATSDSAALECQGFHMSACGVIANLCSVKDPPGILLSKNLFELMIDNGFCTASEPLLVYQPEELAHRNLPIPAFLSEGLQPNQTPLATQSLGYVKGLARTQVATAWCVMCWQQSIPWATEHPKMLQSFRCVYAHHLLLDTPVEIATKNLKISCTGSIRKPPNAIGMVMMIQRLLSKGLREFGQFAISWNKTAPRAYKIQGQMQVTMKNLFDKAPAAGLTLLLAHVQKFGWDNCAVHNESLNNKRIYPGAQFACKTRDWQNRLKITDESFILHVRQHSSTV